MQQIQPDLWQTELENPAPGLTTHAYLLTRKEGNVLFYNTGHAYELDRMAQLGGVERQYLSHRDELGDSINLIRRRFNAHLGGHVAELSDFARVCRPDILFDERDMHMGNIEVIPTPGHSPGSTCFYVESVTGKRYLFTGDTLYLADGDEWRAGFIKGISNREALLASLAVLRQLAPHLVISSAFTGPAGYQAMTPRDWPHQVDRAVAGLTGG
ncbi:MBL fold metallo-hydrolase [Marinobacter sp. SS21]|uniref:MBL fold metallo-hydrolase n=1 Tax=Marinobacter sp. SS21 TaxID=2979460 RepID=UPI00232DDB8C|nr:MBL fold metallo-hydrolase [Marinobacter sp. SS21]MDC0662785.1 MBL fold metallo-hydrolase [Marinobacter sp. SS21]